MYKKRERGRKNNRFTLEHEVVNKKKKSQFSFKWFELGSNLLSIDRREQTAIGCFAYLFSPGLRLDYSACHARSPERLKEMSISSF
jgi:hypothetical protein